MCVIYNINMLIILVYIVFNIGYILGLYQELGIT